MSLDNLKNYIFANTYGLINIIYIKGHPEHDQTVQKPEQCKITFENGGKVSPGRLVSH